MTLTRQLSAVHMEFTAAEFILVSVADTQTGSSEDNSQETSMGVNQHSSNTSKHAGRCCAEHLMM